MATPFIRPEKHVYTSPAKILRANFGRVPLRCDGPISTNLAESQRKHANLCTMISMMPLASMFGHK